MTNTKEELSELTKKYHDKDLKVQAIYRDDEATKEMLLGEFQNKISDKDHYMKEEMQKYISENALLKQQVRELQGLAPWSKFKKHFKIIIIFERPNNFEERMQQKTIILKFVIISNALGLIFSAVSISGTIVLCSAIFS